MNLIGVIQMYNEYKNEKRQHIIQTNNLPRVFENCHQIDETKLPRQLESLYRGFHNLCLSSDSSLILVKDYSKDIAIIYSLIEKMYNTSLKFYYIDTSLLMQYFYQALIENDKKSRQSIQKNIFYYYKKVATADFIFWDYFNINGKNYFTNQIYDMIRKRYNNCRPNMFFVNQKIEDFCRCLTINFREVLDIKKICNLADIQDKIIIN